VIAPAAHEVNHTRISAKCNIHYSLTPRALAAVEATLSEARLARFLPEAKGDKHLAIRLYVWNARLCEAFYLPTQFAEVAIRNAVHRPVLKRFGAAWCESKAFVSILPDRMRDELTKLVADEKRQRRHRFTLDHVVAGLSFGFWLNLMTQAYAKHLWAIGLRWSYPNLPKEIDQQALYNRLDQLRRFRNKIAHHYAIFDRKPRTEMQNTLDIIGWTCSDTRWLAGELANVERVLSRKPIL
jgi:hypothetical protein